MGEMYVPAIACLLMFSSLIVPSTLTGQVYYVKPESMSNCSYHPCLTLDHYVAEETRAHYFTAGSVFNFLAGHHSFQTTIDLNNISNITLRGEDGGVIIINGITISFQNSLLKVLYSYIGMSKYYHFIIVVTYLSLTHSLTR